MSEILVIGISSFPVGIIHDARKWLFLTTEDETKS